MKCEDILSYQISGGWILLFRLKNYQVSIMLCFTPESLEFLLWMFICYKLYFCLQAGSHLTVSRNQWVMSTSIKLPNKWVSSAGLVSLPEPSPMAIETSMSRVQLVGIFRSPVWLVCQIGKNKNNEENEKKSVKLDHFPMDRGEKLEHHHPGPEAKLTK